jgi:hypothetical protein
VSYGPPLRPAGLRALGADVGEAGHLAVGALIVERDSDQVVDGLHHRDHLEQVLTFPSGSVPPGSFISQGRSSRRVSPSRRHTRSPTSAYAAGHQRPRRGQGSGNRVNSGNLQRLSRRQRRRIVGALSASKDFSISVT